MAPVSVTTMAPRPGGTAGTGVAVNNGTVINSGMIMGGAGRYGAGHDGQ